MYEDWLIEQWQTPVSDIRALQMVSLIDDGELAITLRDAHGSSSIGWRFTFGQYPRYQNILEEFRLELWTHLDQTKQWCGRTFIVRDSPWTKAIADREALLNVRFPVLFHYVISTDDDVIEILSPSPPTATEVTMTNTAANKRASTTLYYPRDKTKVEELVREVRQHGREVDR